MIAFILCLFFTFQTESPIQWVSPQHFELGEVLHRQPKTIYFKFKNVSKAPLIIDNVRADCGCTAPSWEKTPIMPDSVATITIKYNAWNKGYFDKKIKVFFNKYKKPENFSLKGKVVKLFDEEE